VILYLEAEFDRYISLLGLGQKTPDLSYLTEIIRAHLAKIPFENISKLYHFHGSGSVSIPPLPQFLDGIEHYHFGGTCYSLNFHLNQLLDYLGYQVIICGADMKKPDVHIVNLVTVDGKEYIVDAGYGAPFGEPVPRDLDKGFVIVSGKDSQFNCHGNNWGKGNTTINEVG